MMEFIAGFGIGLCAGIIGTVAAIIGMQDRGYQIVRTEKLTGREAEELTKALDDVRDADRVLTDRIDAVNDVLDDHNARIGRVTDAEQADRDRIDKLVDVVTLDKEDE